MTYTNFTLETDADGIALITWDSPGKSMNVIDQKVLEEWEAIVDHVAADDVRPDTSGLPLFRPEEEQG